MPAGAVKVDRSTPWGNPFRVGEDGKAGRCVNLYRLLLGGFVCPGAKAILDDQEKARRHLMAHWRELVGKPLACWCPLDKPCHADVLAEAVAILAAKSAEGAK